MKLRTKETESGQYLLFVPDNELDIFLLGKIASKVRHYEMEASTGNDSIAKINKFFIRTDDLLKILEKEFGGN